MLFFIAVHRVIINMLFVSFSYITVPVILKASKYCLKLRNTGMYMYHTCLYFKP